MLGYCHYTHYGINKISTFETLGLNASLVRTVKQLGYESPSPIQKEAIPVFLAGGDLIAKAQTGTGKTAAFSLPIIEQINTSINQPQALILAPTRELAIQVAEALKSYAKHLSSFQVLPIYGGQEYGGQLASLKRGVHVVVGTPGRVMDHIRRGTLKLDALKTFVLDEADEMLKMGFIEDIEWILEQLPTKRQIGLFSATMPPAIQKVANQYLQNPTKVYIESSAKTVALVDQGYIFVAQHNKLEALTRFLETETFDGIIIFARTKTGTTELADKLAARGYYVDALNGDVKQSMREKVIHRLKNKTINIVVATEVAARGLDVERIDLVINYDIPTDPESYVHRIGRTGRAGRSGKAMTFVTPREKGLLYTIERATNTKITPWQVPSLKQLHEKRISNLSNKIIDALTRENLDIYRELIERLSHESEYSTLDIAAGLTFMLQGDILPHSDGKDEFAQPMRMYPDSDHGRQDRGDRKRHRNRGHRGSERTFNENRQHSEKKTEFKGKRSPTSAPAPKGPSRKRRSKSND